MTTTSTSAGRHVTVSMTINGQPITRTVDARTLLVHFIREHARLTGTHIGCDTSNCGACSVMIDGESAKSCTLLAVQADGCSITTIEGVSGPYKGLSAVQEGFRQCHGLQCGYCTPGMIMAATSLLQEIPDPSPEQIRHGLEGNLCRCTGYQMIVESVRWAVEHPAP